MWKITGNDLQNPSYLFGTFHGQGGAQILDSIQAFDSIYKSTSQLVCETKWDIAFRPMELKESKPKKQTNHFKPWPAADSTYANLLTVRQSNKLDSVINSNKVQYLKHYNVRPSGIMKMIKLKFKKAHKELNTNTYTSANDTIKKIILDWHLQNLAKKSDMNIVELDSKEKLKAIADSISSHVSQLSYSTEIDMLMYYIENHSKVDSLRKDRYNRALESYLKKDIAYLYSNSLLIDEISLQKYKKLSEITVKLMIDERNNYWMEKIPNLLAKNSCFIAVGAAHLGGEKGIINQLRKLDYTLVAIK